jgi:hypothetical protein
VLPGMFIPETDIDSLNKGGIRKKATYHFSSDVTRTNLQAESDSIRRGCRIYRESNDHETPTNLW